MSAMGPVTSMTSDIQHLSAYCRPGMDANRTQLCTRIAEQFIAQSDSLLQLTLAIQVGERAGLGELQLSAARNLREAGLLHLASMNGLAPDNPKETCRNMSRQLAFAQRTAEVGELTAVREQMPQRARQ